MTPPFFALGSLLPRAPLLQPTPLVIALRRVLGPCWLTLCCAAVASTASAAAPIPWSKLKQSTALSASTKEVARSAMEQIACYHGCQGSIAQCLSPTPPNKTAWRLANYILFLATKGLTAPQIRQVIDLRKKSVHPAKTATIAVTTAPRLGDPKAKVVIVEYADFQCPHCAEVSPLLEQLVKKSKGQAVLYFKPYPLRFKEGPLLAAKAALAAQRQARFWPMAHLLFGSPGKHTPQGIEPLARKAGLNIDQFRAAMKDHNLLRQLEQNKIEGIRLGINGTPTLFFNGKHYWLRKDQQHLQDRLEEELDLLSK